MMAKQIERVVSLGSLWVVVAGGAGCLGDPALEEPVDETTGAVVYGDDNRSEYLASSAKMQRLANSTAILAESWGLVCDDLNCTAQLEQPFAKDPARGDQVVRGLCPGERFGPSLTAPAGQLTMSSGYCSAFLVAPDVMMTAGHCFIEENGTLPQAQALCPQLRVVFDFKADSFGNVPIGFPAANVRSCRTVLGVKQVGTEDWAVFRLNSSVSGRAPLPIRRAGRIADGENLVTVSYPSGLAVKTLGSASVVSNTSSLFFNANLDLFAGDSGSPIFNRDTETVEGIQQGGETDYVFDYTLTPAGCLRVNTCSNTGGCSGGFEIITRAARAKAVIPSLAPRAFDQSTYSVTNTYIPLSGDFDGNGDTDIVWYRPGSESEKVWWSNGVSKTFDTDEPFESVSGTYAPIVGDFDGDRTADIFWYRAGSGSDTIAYGGRNRTFDERSDSVDGTYTTAAGDFNGDGRTDILWHRPGADSDYISYFTGNRSSPYVDDEFNVDGTYTPIVGDFNGDGRADLVWYRPSGTDKVWYFNADKTHSEKSITVDATFQPFAGDFDGDGFSDIFWYAPGSAADFISYGNAAKTFTMTPAPDSIDGTYVVNVGDYNGDSVSDILWYRPGDQSDYIHFFRIK